MSYLSLRGLGKEYADTTAVVGLDLEVEAGTIFGLLGPNGAGKTTTISMIAGVITPSRGYSLVGGHQVGADDGAAKRAIGLAPQDLALYEELTPDQNLAFFGTLYELRGAALAQRMDWALGVVGLDERRGDVVSTFSGGMKRRLNLAVALLHEPSLLILDEPTVGVDPQSRHHIFETIRSLRDRGMTIIYTSHYMEEVAELCDRIAIMDDGELVTQGTTTELIDRHGGAQVLEIDLAGDDATLVAARAMAGRHGPVEVDGHRFRMPSPARIGPLLVDVESAGARVLRVTAQAVDLETVFLSLTGHSLRD